MNEVEIHFVRDSDLHHEVGIDEGLVGASVDGSDSDVLDGVAPLNEHVAIAKPQVRVGEQLLVDAGLDAFSEERPVGKDKGRAPVGLQEAHEQNQEEVRGLPGAEGRLHVLLAYVLDRAGQEAAGLLPEPGERGGAVLLEPGERGGSSGDGRGRRERYAGQRARCRSSGRRPSR